ncbi:hypothetical protein [Cohnella hashimotonis]|uniref:Uncharacterized protein n=1 Tax=Cohnella hashimotonis TaxID=2826895 RepID=A0ABT6TDB1_9BACL|nr:hypothetical protein [Cohnella hashimotonis]MDI4643944.1 hypothetical protein [Cohnella hashimotonis]
MTEAAGTEELDLQEAAELFRLIYPAFAALLDKAEAARGPLKEFHLAMAAEHAKSGVRILGWDSRRAINAIFDLYKEHYLAEGRIAADLWAADQFGCDLEAAIVESEDIRELEERIKAVVLQIRQRESELQRLRRELGQLEELRAELSRPVILHGTAAGAVGAAPSVDTNDTNDTNDTSGQTDSTEADVAATDRVPSPTPAQ